MENYDHLWFTTSVMPFWFWFWVVVSLVVAFKYRAVGITMLALVIYNLTVWTPSPSLMWLPELFKVAVVVAVIGIVWGFLSANGINKLMAYLGAYMALGVALILMNGHVIGLFDPAKVVDENSSNIGGTTTDEDLQNDIDDVRHKGVKRDNKLERRLVRLENEAPGRSQEVVKLRDDLSELQGQVRL